jgi:hypothetical protein
MRNRRILNEPAFIVLFLRKGSPGTEQKKRAIIEREEGAVWEGGGGTGVVGARRRRSRRAMFLRGVSVLAGMWRGVADPVGAGGAVEVDEAAVKGWATAESVCHRAAVLTSTG